LRMCLRQPCRGPSPSLRWGRHFEKFDKRKRTVLINFALVPGILPGMRPRRLRLQRHTSRTVFCLLHTSTPPYLKKSTDFPNYTCVFILSQIVSYLLVFRMRRTLHFWRRSLRLNIPGRIPGTRGCCAMRLDVEHRFELLPFARKVCTQVNHRGRTGLSSDYLTSMLRWHGSDSQINCHIFILK